MPIGNILPVDIEFSDGGSSKFVLIEGPGKRWYVYGRQGIGFPVWSAVYEQFLDDASNVGVGPENFKPRGSGWITINATKKTVHVWGKGDSYGRYDALLVKTLLIGYVQKNFSGFTLIVDAG